jgi:hypothetical protein
MSDQPVPEPSAPQQFPSFLDLPPRGGPQRDGADQPTTAQPAIEQPTEAHAPVDQPTEAHAPVEQPTVEAASLSEALAQATAPVPPADTGSFRPTDTSGTPPAAVPAEGQVAASEQPTEPVEHKPGFRERGRMRRRLRYLRRVRELQVRDLGGLVFDLRRYERKRDDLIAQKVDQIRASDDELRALEHTLDERRDIRDVRLPGIGGTCPRCFSLYGSTDRFCSHCGAALGGAGQGPAQVAPAAPPPPPAAVQPPPAIAQPPAGPQPLARGAQPPAPGQKPPPPPPPGGPSQ